MPNPSRMFLVRWLAAARNISGAVEWQYSSRKWCSVSQTVEKPALSASLDLVEAVLQQDVLVVRLPGAR